MPFPWFRRGGGFFKACGKCSTCWAGRYSRCRDPRPGELVHEDEMKSAGDWVKGPKGELPMSEENAARITRERLGIEGPEEGRRGYVVVDR